MAEVPTATVTVGVSLDLAGIHAQLTTLLATVEQLMAGEAEGEEGVRYLDEVLDPDLLHLAIQFGRVEETRYDDVGLTIYEIAPRQDGREFYASVFAAIGDGLTVDDDGRIIEPPKDPT